MNWKKRMSGLYIGRKVKIKDYSIESWSIIRFQGCSISGNNREGVIREIRNEHGYKWVHLDKSVIKNWVREDSLIL